MTNQIEAVSRLRCETETPAPPALVSNRRKFVMNSVVSVASLVSATAVALPVAVASDLPIPERSSYPELEAKLEAAHERWLQRELHSAAEQEDLEREVEAATGMSFEDSPACGEPGYAKYDRTRRRLVELHCERFPEAEDGNGGSIEYNEIWDQIDEVAEAASTIEIKTLADVGLVARACALKNYRYWTSARDADAADELRELTERLGAAAGIQLLPGAEPLFEE
jgi:hypothetical protein